MKKNKILSIVCSAFITTTIIPFSSVNAVDTSFLNNIFKPINDEIDISKLSQDEFIDIARKYPLHSVTIKLTEFPGYWDASSLSGGYGILDTTKDEIKKYCPYGPGDLDMDGIVTQHDVQIFIQTFYVPKAELKPTENPKSLFYYLDSEDKESKHLAWLKLTYLADVTGNGIIDANDLSWISKEAEENNYKLGDVNMDGEVNVDDASCVLTEYAKKSAGLETTFTEQQKNIADVRGNILIKKSEDDISVTVDDASAILERYARQAAGLPAIEGDSVLADYLG